MMPRHHRLAEIWLADYLGAPYRLGGMSRQEGYDCLSLVFTLLCRLGADLKPFWGERDITNYWIDYDLEQLPEWVRSLGEEIDVRRRQPGDVLLCLLADGQWHASVFLGQGLCTLVNGSTGTIGCCPFAALKPWVVEVRRCLK
jgi:cell wall-associated NlpC family hydrolase